MKTLNIGILAHVDAGKTTLTENILHEVKVINHPGKVDFGNTLTDSLDLERKRGITIKASTVSFMIGDLKVNLLDTPGHADFITEVDRAISVLDGAILVISAVEGVQAQTRILMNSLIKFNIPTILFINKIDRVGANTGKVLADIEKKLTDRLLTLYECKEEGTPKVEIHSIDYFHDVNSVRLESCIETLALNNESFLDVYVEGLDEEVLQSEIIKQSKQAQVFPILMGSAVNGIGIKELVDHLEKLLPINYYDETKSSELTAQVFKIERKNNGEKKAYIRVYSGTLNVREEVIVNRGKNSGEYIKFKEKVKKLSVFCKGHTLDSEQIISGDIGIIHGYKNLKLGDVIGERTDQIREITLTEPTMETAIEAVNSEDCQRLYQALSNMAEEDPLINLSRNGFNKEICLKLYGEVQKEIIESNLLEDYDIEINFGKTRVVCIEKPKRTGQAMEVMGSDENPFYATLGFKIEPGKKNSGIHYRLDVELGSLPLSFHKAIEETVYSALKQGLYGWEVTDIIVSLTHTGYFSPITTARDFRNLTPIVLMSALQQAGTGVYEPINGFELTVPEGALSRSLSQLSKRGAAYDYPLLKKDMFVITGRIPVATTELFKAEVNHYTEGEGVFLTQLFGYRELYGRLPTKERQDYNPLNRKEYIMHVIDQSM